MVRIAQLNCVLSFYYSLRNVCNILGVHKPFIIKFTYLFIFNIHWEIALGFINLLTLEDQFSIHEQKSMTYFESRKYGQTFQKSMHE